MENNNNNNINNNIDNNQINSDDSFVIMPNPTPLLENKPKKKKRKKMNLKFLSYFLVALIFFTLGGVGTMFSTLYLLPKSDLLKSSPLYSQLIEDAQKAGMASYHPTELKADGSALSTTEIVAKVGPAVVGVATKSVAGVDFFGNQQVSEGIGSGIIISEDGYVLTNNHVISGAQTVKVILSNGQEVSAKVMNYDAAYDVAIVKITDNIKMPAVAELGTSSSLKAGEQVVAIGNPLGKEFLGSVTTGIVSAVNRQIEENSEVKYIQTDTAINSGNSGGPLLNSQGQVIGINTAKIGATGVEGMGFAIPIDVVKDKIPSLSKPALRIGISGGDVTDAMVKQYAKQQLTLGVLVSTVQEFSPAEKAGIKNGDIIVKFDGKEVKTINQLNQYKLDHKAGDTVKIEIKRQDKDGKYTQTVTVDLTLVE